MIIEFHGHDVEWWAAMVEGGASIIKDGYITPPSKPGLGLLLNEDTARAHMQEGSSFFV
jgi:L-alanine-DL-glutamate epimerase-like enolase superfamily enzyme